MGDVHLPRTSGRPRSAVVAAGLLLLICTLLAAVLVGTRQLAPPVQPDGWAIRFRPPRGWDGGLLSADPYQTTVVYREPGTDPAGRELLFTRLPNSAVLSTGQVFDILREDVFRRRFGTLGSLLQRPQVSVEARPLGPLPGRRALISGAGGVCLHVGTRVPEQGEAEAYALELWSNRPVTPGDIGLCDALARAVEPAD